MRQIFPVGGTAVLFSYNILKDVVWSRTVGQRLTLCAAGKCSWVQAREQDGDFVFPAAEGVNIPNPRVIHRNEINPFPAKCVLVSNKEAPSPHLVPKTSSPNQGLSGLKFLH